MNKKIFSLGSMYLQLNKLISEASITATKINRQFNRPELPKNPNSEINLHLGCGSINHPNFINVDARPAAHIHYVRFINDLSPFHDNSVNLIYACHCLEHFPYNDVPKVLSEWFRVLKNHGVLRLSVPNFDLLINIYKDQEDNLESIVPLLMGGQDYEFNFHKSAFNASNLKKILLKTGFQEVRNWQPGRCDMTTFNDWSGRQLGGKYPVSLNLEAIKIIDN